MTKKIDYEILDLINNVNANFSKMSELYDNRTLTPENAGEYCKGLIVNLLKTGFISATDLNKSQKVQKQNLYNFKCSSDKLNEYIISLELNLLAYKQVCDILEILVRQRMYKEN